LNRDYLLWAIRAGRPRLEMLATGTTFPAVTGPVLRRFRIPIPPMDDQLTLVHGLRTHLNALADAAGRSDIRPKLRQWLVAQRFAAFGGATSIVSLAELSSIQSGMTKSATKAIGEVEVPYLSTANVQAGRLDLGTIKTIRATEQQREKHALVADDVLVVEGGDPDKVGRGWIWNGEIEGCLHQNHVFAVRVDAGRLNARYLAHFINAPQARSYFLGSAKQTTGIASINKKQLRALPVPLPRLDLQARVVDHLDQVTERVVALQSQVEHAAKTARALRMSLLHSAFTGRPFCVSSRRRENSGSNLPRATS
jgi:type I restriction enzyme S subunit